MLTQSDKAIDRRFIIESFHSAERFSSVTNLAALAAAYIELDGEAAISLITRRYFGDRDRGKEELLEVQKALSLHGSEGRTDLRNQIVASYAVLLKNHPDMAQRVAADLLAWKRSELAEQLAGNGARASLVDKDFLIIPPGGEIRQESFMR